MITEKEKQLRLKVASYLQGSYELRSPWGRKTRMADKKKWVYVFWANDASAIIAKSLLDTGLEGMVSKAKAVVYLEHILREIEQDRNGFCDRKEAYETLCAACRRVAEFGIPLEMWAKK